MRVDAEPKLLTNPVQLIFLVGFGASEAAQFHSQIRFGLEFGKRLASERAKLFILLWLIDIASKVKE